MREILLEEREMSNKVKGAVIVGYQGIGKSTLAKSGNGYIDLESGNFWVDGKRTDDWYIPYCKIAVHLAEQGYKVFVSSHAVVREYLASLPKTIPLFACFPSYSLKDTWITKLQVRYERTQLEKDYKMLKNDMMKISKSCTKQQHLFQ